MRFESLLDIIGGMLLQQFAHWRQSISEKTFWWIFSAFWTLDFAFSLSSNLYIWIARECSWDFHVLIIC